MLQNHSREIFGHIVSQYRFYLLALPVSLSVAASLFLTQIPDSDAGRQFGKQSVSVMLDPKNILKLTALMLLLCIVAFSVAIALTRCLQE